MLAIELERLGDLPAVLGVSAPANVPVLANPFYRRLPRGFSGSQEYAAPEEDCTLAEDPTWDPVVVDTPPARRPRRRTRTRRSDRVSDCAPTGGDGAWTP